MKDSFGECLLVAINAKYSHTNPAVRYLKNAAKHIGGINTGFIEMTINQSDEFILRKIMETGASRVGFSIYIWNVDAVLRISEKLRALRPDVTIIFGGPEVTFDPHCDSYSVADYIITGEGEYSFVKLMKSLIEGVEAERVMGSENLIDLDLLPFVYSDIDELENKIIYYESSRGCPFNCSYCLSSTTKELRYASIEKVKRDLLTMLKAKVMQVKFVDRTFNSKPDRTLEIMEFIVENDNGFTGFHFEITASILTDDVLKFIAKVRKGLFQFEIGLQTSNVLTTKAVGRMPEAESTVIKSKKLVEAGNCHIHLDLIAGLPYEDYDSFLKSIDFAFRAEPHMLQIGFLKMLKGSRIRSEAEKHRYIFDKNAPYEVMANQYISYKEMCSIKDIEAVVESIYNNGYLRNTVFAIARLEYDGSFSHFLREFSEVLKSEGYFERSISRESLAVRLTSFIKERGYNPILEDLLAFEAASFGIRALQLLDRKYYARFDEGEKSLVHHALRMDAPDGKVKDLLKKLVIFQVDYHIMNFIESGFRDIIKFEKEFNVFVFSSEQNPDNTGSGYAAKSYEQQWRFYEFNK